MDDQYDPMAIEAPRMVEVDDSDLGRMCLHLVDYIMVNEEAKDIEILRRYFSQCAEQSRYAIQYHILGLLNSGEDPMPEDHPLRRVLIEITDARLH